MVHHLELVDDSPSVLPNADGFIENRHDQSVFSLLCKMTEGVILGHAFGEYGIDGDKGPIRASRIKK